MKTTIKNNKFKKTGEYTWECPICPAKCSKNNTHTKSNCYGNKHINIFHPDERYNIYPIVTRINLKKD